MSKFVVFLESEHNSVARRVEEVLSVEKELVNGENIPKVVFKDGEFIYVELQTFSDIINMLNENS